MRYRLDGGRPETVAAMPPPAEGDFPRFRCKNMPWASISSLATPYVASVVEAMNALVDRSPSAGRRHRHVDVKVHDLAPGQPTANDLWHLDCSLVQPGAGFDNLLFVTGEHALTEFVVEPLSFEAEPSAGAFHRAVEACGVRSERAPSCAVVRYDGTHVHRGPRATGAERRLLIRMVTTDVLLPRVVPRPVLSRACRERAP